MFRTPNLVEESVKKKIIDRHQSDKRQLDVIFSPSNESLLRLLLDMARLGQW